MKGVILAILILGGILLCLSGLVGVFGVLTGTLSGSAFVGAFVSAVLLSLLSQCSSWMKELFGGSKSLISSSVASFLGALSGTYLSLKLGGIAGFILGSLLAGAISGILALIIISKLSATEKE